MSDPSAATGRAHEKLDRALAVAGATCDAAEAHGTLCSLICLHGSRAGSHWLAGMLGGGAGGGPARAALLELAGETASELEDPDFPFTPLLPADAESMPDRAEAIAHWARGFLHGLAEAGTRPALAARLQEEPLAELMEDLTEITQAVAGEEESAESNEEAYAELVEYLRVAAQLFYLELAAFRSDRHEAPAGLQ